MEIIMVGYSKPFTVGVFIGTADNVTITKTECGQLLGEVVPSLYCCQEPTCEKQIRYPSGTCSTSMAYWPTVLFDKGANGGRIATKPKPGIFDFDSDWRDSYSVRFIYINEDSAIDNEDSSLEKSFFKIMMILGRAGTA